MNNLSRRLEASFAFDNNCRTKTVMVDYGKTISEKCEEKLGLGLNTAERWGGVSSANY